MSSRRTRHLRWEYAPEVALNPTTQLVSAQKALSSPAERDAAGGLQPQPVHDPPLSVRDEAIFLLHIAAEVEHALMVQYLYAAYSLGGAQTPPEHVGAIHRWRQIIIGIAREEMGHLATVQNLLLSIGGPLTFEREDYPFHSDLYPFPFKLERLTRHSLAKYVIAEMPPNLHDAEIEEIKTQARMDNRDRPVNRVGALYERLGALFQELQETDFEADSAAFQARWSEWGQSYSNLLIRQVRTRAEALDAIHAIAEQGEGVTLTPNAQLDDNSHFCRFLTIYRSFPQEGEWTPSAPMPEDPNLDNAPADSNRKGRITHPLARAWAQLFNRRYRMLLIYLSHAFHIESPEDGTHTPRGVLLSWTFGEMYNLRSITAALTLLPQTADPADSNVAGPPFDMPYTLTLPDREADRWRLHRDLLESSAALIDALGPQVNPQQQSYLEGLKATDTEALQVIAALLGQTPSQG